MARSVVPAVEGLASKPAARSVNALGAAFGPSPRRGWTCVTIGAMAQDDRNQEVWLPVGAAAETVGIPRRTLFRWAAKGSLPVRRVGARRLVEVSALRAMAAVSRGKQATVAHIGATSEAVADPPPPAPSPVGAEELEALSETVTSHEELLNGLWGRVEGIERHLGLRP